MDPIELIEKGGAVGAVLYVHLVVLPAIRRIADEVAAGRCRLPGGPPEPAPPPAPARMLPSAAGLLLAVALIGCVSGAARASAVMLRDDLAFFRSVASPSSGTAAAEFSAAGDALERHAAELVEATR